ETFPAGSDSMALNVYAPSDSPPSVICHFPSAPTGVVKSIDPLRNVIVSPATPVPVITGFLLVMLSPTTPLSLAGASARLPGGSATVSMVTAKAAEAAETSPATSVSLAVNVCAPSANALEVIDHVPPAPTVAVPTDVDPSNSVIVSPATPVPVITG